MSNINREAKKKIGRLLMKIKSDDMSLTTEEWDLARLLETKKLVQYLGPPETGPMFLSPSDAYRRVALAAMASFRLDGEGHAFFQRYTEKQILEGRFLLPGEIDWRERWHVKEFLNFGLNMVGACFVAWVTVKFISPPAPADIAEKCRCQESQPKK